MIPEDKQLLLHDLSARLPYGVKVKYAIPTLLVSVRNDRDGIKVITEGTYGEHIYNIEDIKPYLRPMSSMTKDEEKEYNSFIAGIEPFNSDFSAYPKEYKFVYEFDIKNYIDYLNAHHFDYRGLIEKGLAIAVTDKNNPYK